MDSQKVDMFLMTNGKFFDTFHLQAIRERLLQMDDSKFFMLHSIGFKDPTVMLIVSLVGGHLGIDRFLLGETGLGVAKLLTCGGLGVWTIIDWFMVMGHTRDLNIQKLQMVLNS